MLLLCHWPPLDMHIMLRLNHKLSSDCLMITGHLTRSMELCWFRGPGPIYSLTKFLLVPDLQCLPGQWSLLTLTEMSPRVFFQATLGPLWGSYVSLNSTSFHLQWKKLVSPLESAQTYTFLSVLFGLVLLMMPADKFCWDVKRRLHFFPFPLQI